MVAGAQSERRRLSGAFDREVAEDGTEPPAPPASRTRAALTLGIGLIVVGGLLIARNVVPWFDSSLFWPLVVVCGGLLPGNLRREG